MYIDGYNKPTFYASLVILRRCHIASTRQEPIGTQTITTRLPYLEEININDDNAIILEFDVSNLKEVVEKIKKQAHKRISWEIPKDNYRSILAKGKSKYKEMKKNMAKVKVTVRFRDMANNGIWREVGHEIECDKERAKVIVEHGFGQLIEEAIEPVEKAVKEVKKEKAIKEKATKEVKPEKKATIKVSAKKNAKK